MSRCRARRTHGRSTRRFVGCRLKSRANSGRNRLEVRVYCLPPRGSGVQEREATLFAVVGIGDDGRPVVTITLRRVLKPEFVEGPLGARGGLDHEHFEACAQRPEPSRAFLAGG